MHYFVHKVPYYLFAYFHHLKSSALLHVDATCCSSAFAILSWWMQVEVDCRVFKKWCSGMEFFGLRLGSGFRASGSRRARIFCTGFSIFRTFVKYEIYSTEKKFQNWFSNHLILYLHDICPEFSHISAGDKVQNYLRFWIKNFPENFPPKKSVCCL